MHRLLQRDTNRVRGPWCSTCNQEKHSAKHWFEVRQLSGALVIRLLGPEVRAVTPGHSPVCSEGCMSTLVSQWMSEQTPAPPEKAAMQAVAEA